MCDLLNSGTTLCDLQLEKRLKIQYFKKYSILSPTMELTTNRKSHVDCLFQMLSLIIAIHES